MSFADDYLQKHSLRGPLISTPPQSDLQCIVAIPAYNESRLITCLDSLFQCDPFGISTEVIVLINSPENVSATVDSTNKKSLEEIVEWKKEHQRDDLIFHAIHVRDLPAKHAGAGLSRKLVMDEAIQRFNTVGNKNGIVLSLDADTTVEKNYLSSLHSHFKLNPTIVGCSIYFEHPLSGDEHPPEVYDAIINYELHLRYYLHAVRSTGFPYAYHTVGSAFGVRASAYCSQGGMNKRKAGEDFYFIQKLALLGLYSNCTTTTVYPSPRPSDRVPFGTGPDIRRQIENPGQAYLTYNFKLFVMLKEFFGEVGGFYEGGSGSNSDSSSGSGSSSDSDSDSDSSLISALPEVLKEYLLQTDIYAVLAEIRSNSASEKTFVMRFFRHFNMFWILKFLHFGEERGYMKMEIGEAVRELLGEISKSTNAKNTTSLLIKMRSIDSSPERAKYQ